MTSRTFLPRPEWLPRHEWLLWVYPRSISTLPATAVESSGFPVKSTGDHSCTRGHPSFVPRPPCPAFTACSTKSGGKAWKDLSRDACCCWRHVQSVHIWVCSLPFTLHSLNSVRYFCSVCPARAIATGSIVASYSTWHQQRHASCDKSFQAFPPRFVLQVTKAGHGGLGTRLGSSLLNTTVWGVTTGGHSCPWHHNGAHIDQHEPHCG